MTCVTGQCYWKRIWCTKKRFHIIARITKPTYGVSTQNEIILSRCTLRNYLMGVDLDESLVAEVAEEVVTFPSWTCGPYSKRRWWWCLARYYKRFYSISHVAELCPNVITFGFIVVMLFKIMLCLNHLDINVIQISLSNLI